MLYHHFLYIPYCTVIMTPNIKTLLSFADDTSVSRRRQAYLNSPFWRNQPISFVQFSFWTANHTSLTYILSQMALVLESGDKGAGIETARPRNRHLPNVTNHVRKEMIRTIHTMADTIQSCIDVWKRGHTLQFKIEMLYSASFSLLTKISFVL